ncbi:hypothetical protein [Methylobacterium soli]|uniref:hypothetical protein n=1 Tax=Methylobacterium soli TaxID=553447 RepID=UPI001EE19F7C|nr:hypothetical protein [Methylobacterium soli]
MWILSDLRVDLDPAFALPDPLPSFDAILVAGGIAAGLDASLRWLAAALDGRQGHRPVIFVPGNIEFWSDIPLVEALARGRALASELGLHLLSDDAFRFEASDGSGVFVVGATMWTDWALEGPFQGKLARVHARHGWPDGERIMLRRDRLLSPLDVLAAHARSRAYVEDALATIRYQALGYASPPKAPVTGVRRGDRAIVLTCHGPSRHSLPPDWPGWFQDGWVAASLASDLEDVMDAWGAPGLWVHGNVPKAVDYVIGRTRVVANPPGRPPRRPAVQTVPCGGRLTSGARDRVRPQTQSESVSGLDADGVCAEECMDIHEHHPGGRRTPCRPDVACRRARCSRRVSDNVLALWRSWNPIAINGREAGQLAQLISATEILHERRWRAARDGDPAASAAVAIDHLHRARTWSPLTDVIMGNLILRAWEGDATAPVIIDLALRMFGEQLPDGPVLTRHGDPGARRPRPTTRGPSRRHHNEAASSRRSQHRRPKLVRVRQGGCE